jgi:hypothetical protein
MNKTQLSLFEMQNNLIHGNTVLWDGKRIPLDEAIKWAKLKVKLAPSFTKYQNALEFLQKAKNDINRNF